MAVSVKTEPAFSRGKPEKLFSGTYVTSASGDVPSWDISPDGKRFIMLKQAAADEKSSAETPHKIIMVTNWFEELKERVPLE